MDDAKWQDTIGRIQDDFEVYEHATRQFEDGPGSAEYIIFKSPLGKIKLERTTKPLVLDRKAIGSKRIGSQTAVEYVYSDTEKVHTMKAYQWEESRHDWVEMERGLFV